MVIYQEIFREETDDFHPLPNSALGSNYSIIPLKPFSLHHATVYSAIKFIKLAGQGACARVLVFTVDLSQWLGAHSFWQCSVNIID